MKLFLLSGLIIILGGFGLLGIENESFEEFQSQSPTNQISCANPGPANAAYCYQMEQYILNTTARIRIESWVVKEDESGYAIDYSEGHATVKDGRSLVTHNHFSIPLSILQQGDGSYSVIYLYNTEGLLLHKGSLSDFELLQQENESLVFTHKDANFLTQLGFTSAQFKDAGTYTIEIGSEIAQIDWDGQTTRVDWTTVTAVRLLDGTLVLVFDDDTLPGASGGGIFWNGEHIANNWRIEEQIDSAGDTINTITIAALNRSIAE